MTSKTPVYNEFEVQAAAIIKSARQAIRLRHSLAADDEIARVVPELRKRISSALLEGKALTVDVAREFGLEVSA